MDLMCHRWAMTQSLQGRNWHVPEHAPSLLTVLHVTSANTLLMQAVIKRCGSPRQRRMIEGLLYCSLLMLLKWKGGLSQSVVSINSQNWGMTYVFLVVTWHIGFFSCPFHTQNWSLCELCINVSHWPKSLSN